MGSLANKINYQKIFEGLAARGITLTPEQQQQIQDAGETEAKEHDNNIGMIATDGFAWILAFIQNLVSGFSLDHLGETFSSATETSNGKTSLRQIDGVTSRMYMKLVGQGFDTRTASLITGQATGGQTPEYMPGCAYEQLRPESSLPMGVSSNLNMTASNTTPPQTAYDADHNSITVPTLPPTPGLTQTRKVA